MTKVVSFQFNCKNNPKILCTLHAHIIPNIVKISLKRVEMNFCPGSKNSIIAKTATYDRIINELCHFYKVSLIKTGLMFHKYHLLNQLQLFTRYKKITKMSFNIPLRSGYWYLAPFSSTVCVSYILSRDKNFAI